MFWQCQTHPLSEDGLLQDDTFSSIRNTDSTFWPLEWGSDDNYLPCLYWWKWVVDYSFRSLTRRSDWLAALAGITQYFAEETGLTPYLGMWKEFLIDDLSWTVPDPNMSSRSAVINIPTWSWLRFDSPIKSPTYQKCSSSKIFARVDEVDVSWTGVPLASEIVASRLILRGQVKYLTFDIRYNVDEQKTFLYLKGQQKVFGKLSR